ncbi:hypothetical protein [Acidovorax sp.]|uniref:hypothetical protein n=2 Tax=unclassified Acidovorax TaxID=2684926 RepID=UPI00070B33A2
MPADLGIGGQIPIGWVLGQLDQAGAVLPGGHFRRNVALVQLDAIEVEAMPMLGDFVTFRARLLDAGAERARVEVQALRTSRGAQGPEQEQVLRTCLVYVPLPAEGSMPD